MQPRGRKVHRCFGKCGTSGGVDLGLTYLKVNLDAVEGGGAGARDGACDAAGEQVPSPHARDHLAIGEIIWHSDVLTDVHVL